MDQPTVLGKSRIIILCAVLALHLGALALLIAASRTLHVGASPEQAIEVMLIPPAIVPKVRAENVRPERMSTNVAIALTPPTLNSSLQSATSSAPDGRGSAVNWAAEAHRALRAFEIRRDQPANSAISVSSSLDEWWPREHRAGDRFKTDSGDWIVWINANCYQVAGWHSNSRTNDARPSQTICSAKDGAPRAD